MTVLTVGTWALIIILTLLLGGLGLCLLAQLIVATGRWDGEC